MNGMVWAPSILRKGLRFSGEYMKGNGMIWQAPHNPSFGIGPGQGNPNAPGNGAFAKSNGYYVEGGYRFPGTKWELDLRYDVYNRLDGDRFEIKFERTTLGVQYFFNPRVRIALNYEFTAMPMRLTSRQALVRMHRLVVSIVVLQSRSPVSGHSSDIV